MKFFMFYVKDTANGFTGSQMLLNLDKNVKDFLVLKKLLSRSLKMELTYLLHSRTEQRKERVRRKRKGKGEWVLSQPEQVDF